MKRLAPALAVGLLVIAAVLAALTTLPRRWFEPPPRPPRLFTVQAIVTPAGSRAKAAPRGAQIEPDGTLTVLSAPGSQGRALPWTSQPSRWGVRPRPVTAVPAAMLAGIRALFRLVPPPPVKRDELVVTTLERTVSTGRLILARGCFRLDNANGPLAVFPPGTRLGLVDGYLMVGPPGLPPELSARVGEHLFWEGPAITGFDEASRRRMAAACGPGPAQTVFPASATVQQARNEGLAASELADRYGVPWDEALESVRRCRARGEQSFPGLRGAPLVDIPCGSTPPRPVASQADCPPGTKLSGGLCRTPEGHIRPIPAI